jgi:predicted secreted protein
MNAWRALTASLMAILLVPMAALAQAPAPAPDSLFNLVTLNAQAEREVPNDLLSAALSAEAEGADPAQLADSVNRSMQAALVVARSYASVKTRSGSYQTSPVYEKSRVVRWRVRQELRLESTNIAAATELIGKLQASLVVNGMVLSVSPEVRRQTENALIAEAHAAFEERARLVRDAMKAKGYRVRDLQFSGGGPAPFPMFLISGRSAAAEARAQPAIEPGTTRILISVSGTVQMQ